MEQIMLRIFFSFCLLNVDVKATNPSFHETVSEDRQARVSGRIVKLYSGIQPEPVYCAREGFQADPIHCATFYRCVKGATGKYTVFRFQCGPGTVYDPDVETCNYPQRTKRQECGGLDKSQTEIPQIASMPPDLDLWRPELPSPIASRPVYSEPNKNTSTSYHWATSKPSTSSVYPWDTDPPQSFSSKVPVISQLSQYERNKCTVDGFMGDSENCRKFYRCVGNQRGGFIRYEFTCSEPTVWDEDAQSCNHPWAVQRSRCGKNNINIKLEDPSISNRNHLDQQTDKHYSANTIQQQLQINYGNKISQTQTQINHGSVNQNQTQINYEDHEKGRKTKTKQNQTQISYGSAISQSQTQINHGEGAVQTQLQIDHTKDSSQAQTTTTHEENSEGGYGNQENEQFSSEKPVLTEDNQNQCKESGFMGDKNNCKKFYRCVDNGKGGFIRYEFLCGEGTVWDSSIESCNHAWAVKSCGELAPQNTSQEVTQTTTKRPNESTQTSIESTTDDEIEDTGYGQQNQDFSSTSTTTTKQPHNGGENDKNNECKSSGFMGDNDDCKKFYRCVDNGNGGYTRYEFSCGEGTVWDPKIEACNHAWAVEKCGQDDSDIFKETTSSTKPTLLVSNDEEVLPTTSSGSENSYPEQSQESIEMTKKPQTTFNPPSTQASRVECTQEGFMADKIDCKKFYRCVDNGNGGFLKYEFSCGDGTVWDPEITACNHENSKNRLCYISSSPQEENVSQTTVKTTVSPGTQTTSWSEGSTENVGTTKPSLSKDCSQEGFMSDESNCKKFYRCVDNGKGGFTKHEFACGEGTVWDSELNTCNHPPPDSKCGDSSGQSSVTSTEPHRENDNAINTESSLTSTFEQSTTTQSNEKLPSSYNDCTFEGFFGDSSNCKKFYRCVDDGKGGFTKYDFTCGDGTVWDQEIQTCNHETNKTNCFENNEPSTIAPISNGITEDSTVSLSTENQINTQKPQSSNESRAECTSEGFYANPDDCRKFYRCVDNGKGGFTKYDFVCGDGTAWVQEIQGCDHDNGEICSNLSNDSSLLPPSSQESYGEQSTNSSIAESTSQMPDKQNDEDSNDTSNFSSSNASNDVCDTEGFYPNKNDCRKFYRCVDNGNGGFTKYDFTCGEGTAWDADIQTCNHINEVQSCKKQENPTQANFSQDEETSTENNSQTSSTTEKSKPDNKDICEQEGYFGNSEDCTKFYRCVDNGKGGFTKYDFTCGEGTIWDQDVKTCNHPQDVVNPSCQQSSGDETSDGESSTSKSTTTSSSSKPESTSSSNNNSSSSDCSTKKPSNNNVNCTKAGYYPDPDDCKMFYRCVDWDGNGEKFSVYHFECGEGTIWDPALDTCNHEDSVYPPRDCNGSQSQSENVGEQTTTPESTTENTTDQSTTELITTQETTTNEQTTQSSEKTTTLQTTEGTTTQESELSTTEQSTTEQITTQQTSEQTTTEKTTTLQTTTQQTDEETTQQSSTVVEQTTTEEASEQSTTNSEQTTTQKTTEQTTTQQTMTQESTTSESSTQLTTEQSTQSNDGTTQESMTEQSTTEQSTTEQWTTEQSTTEQSTTEQLTTKPSTTEQSATSQTQDSGTTATTSAVTQSSDSSTTENLQESTTESSSEQTTENSSSEKECPETEDDQNMFVCPTSFRRHPKYCNMFYQCTEDDDTHDVQIATFHCPNNTIYDENQTKCVEEKKAQKKCDGEMAQKRRLKRFDIAYKEPIIVTSERLKCPAPGHYPFEKGECSPAFLKCQKTNTGKVRGYVYQCPQNYVYWSVSRRCEPKGHLRDCKKSYNDWNGRWEIPVERRNIAP